MLHELVRYPGRQGSPRGTAVAMFSGRSVAFLICSDWPQDSETFSRFRVTFGSGDLIEDMYAFADCDYLIPFSAAIQKDNFYAVQFHTEKSGKEGEKILKNFLEL